MKNKSEISAFLMFVGLLYIEFHCITPDSHSALTRLADINWAYLCLVIGIALFISMLALSYIHDILLFFKLEKDGDITYSFVVTLPELDKIVNVIHFCSFHNFNYLVQVLELHS